MAKLDLQGWSIDYASFHAANRSGLYAYIDPNPSKFGALRCIGPFSCPNSGLTAESVREQLVDLTEILEVSDLGENVYCLWGSYTKRLIRSIDAIQILGEEFSFIPNPSLRSDALLNSTSRHYDKNHDLIHREWSFGLEQRSIAHRSGLNFIYRETNGHHKNRKVECFVSTQGWLDESAINPQLSEILIRALSVIGYRLLCPSATTRIDTQESRSLSIHIQENIDQQLAPLRQSH